MKPKARLFIARRKEEFWHVVAKTFRPMNLFWHFATRREIAALNEQTGIHIEQFSRPTGEPLGRNRNV